MVTSTESKKLTRDDIYNLAHKHAPGLENLVMAFSKLEGADGKSAASYKPKANGVVGPLQVMSKQLGGKSGTFEAYAAPGMTDPLNPEHATVAGVRFLKDLYDKHYAKTGLDGVAAAYFSGRTDTPNYVSDGKTTVGQYKQIIRDNLTSLGGLPNSPTPDSMLNTAKELAAQSIKETQDKGDPLSIEQLKEATRLGLRVPNPSLEMVRQQNYYQSQGQPIPSDVWTRLQTDESTGGSNGTADSTPIIGDSTQGSAANSPDYLSLAWKDIQDAKAKNSGLSDNATAALQRYSDAQTEAARRRTQADFQLSYDGYQMDKDKNGFWSAFLNNVVGNRIEDKYTRPAETAQLAALGDAAKTLASTGKTVADINNSTLPYSNQIGIAAEKSADSEQNRRIREAQLAIEQEKLRQMKAINDAKLGVMDNKMSADEQERAILAKGLERLGIQDTPDAYMTKNKNFNKNVYQAVMAAGAGESGGAGSSPFATLSYAEDTTLPMGDTLRNDIRTTLSPIRDVLLKGNSQTLADAKKAAGWTPQSEGTKEGAAAKARYLEDMMNKTLDSMSKGITPDYLRGTNVPNPYAMANEDVAKVTSQLATNGGVIQPKQDLPSLAKYLAFGSGATPEVAAAAMKEVAGKLYENKNLRAKGLPQALGVWVPVPGGNTSVDVSTPKGIVQYKAAILAAEAKTLQSSMLSGSNSPIGDFLSNIKLVTP